MMQRTLEGWENRKCSSFINDTTHTSPKLEDDAFGRGWKVGLFSHGFEVFHFCQSSRLLPTKATQALKDCTGSALGPLLRPVPVGKKITT